MKIKHPHDETVTQKYISRGLKFQMNRCQIVCQWQVRAKEFI